LIKNWIEEYSWFGDVHVYESFHDSDLRRSYGATGIIATAKIKQRVVKILDGRTQRFEFVAVNLITRLEQKRIAKQEYFADSHLDYLE